MYSIVQSDRSGVCLRSDQVKARISLIAVSVLSIALAICSGSVQAGSLSQEAAMVNVPSDIATQSRGARTTAPRSDATAHGAAGANVDLGASATSAVVPGAGAMKASPTPADSAAAAADTDVALAPPRVSVVQQSVGASAASATAAATTSAPAAASGKTGSADFDGPAK